MSTAELLRKVRRLEIRSRRLVEDVFAGSSESVFKGRGVEFEEVRPYVPGDEVRDIDWNVTARLGQPFVKRFVEERELTVLLAVDVSESMRFGTRAQAKRELAAELAAVLGFAATRNNDRVGLLLAAGEVEHFVRPARGRTHLLRLLRDLLAVEPATRHTQLGAAARFAARALHRRSLVFWLSDFEDRLDHRDWRVLARRHEVTAMLLRDPRDEQLPNVGWVELEDLESGRRELVDTGRESVRRAYQARARERRRQVEQELGRVGASVLELRTDRSYLPELMRWFGSKRGRRGAA